jgi:hypothetical protein
MLHTALLDEESKKSSKLSRNIFLKTILLRILANQFEGSGHEGGFFLASSKWKILFLLS